MAKNEEFFKKEWKRILNSRSPEMLHLKCRRCHTEGYAASLEVADLFGGWTKLRPQKGFHYTGLCIECSYSKPRKKKRRKP